MSSIYVGNGVEIKTENKGNILTVNYDIGSAFEKANLINMFSSCISLSNKHSLPVHVVVHFNTRNRQKTFQDIDIPIVPTAIMQKLLNDESFNVKYTCAYDTEDVCDETKNLMHKLGTENFENLVKEYSKIYADYIQRNLASQYIYYTHSSNNEEKIYGYEKNVLSKFSKGQTKDIKTDYVENANFMQDFHLGDISTFQIMKHETDSLLGMSEDRMRVLYSRAVKSASSVKLPSQTLRLLFVNNSYIPMTTYNGELNNPQAISNNYSALMFKKYLEEKLMTTMYEFSNKHRDLSQNKKGEEQPQ